MPRLAALALLGLALGLPSAASCAQPAAVSGAAAAQRPAASAAGSARPALLAHGEAVYARCVACHSIEGNRTGPQHCGLFGRRAGSAPGYDAYSPALKASGITWTARTLDRFIADPLRAVPGTAMAFSGVPDARERADLIAWLRAATRPGTSCTVQP